MPSPLAHLSAAALVTTWSATRSQLVHSNRGWAKLFAVSAVLTMLPDLPTILGLFTGDLSTFHNRGEHSLFMGLMVSAVFAPIAGRLTRLSWKTWFSLSILCYGLHVLMDYLTVGRGVMLLWPLTDQRFGSPLKLFYGLHWSEGFWSWRHGWTLLSEAVAVVLILTVMWFVKRRREQPHEASVTPDS